MQFKLITGSAGFIGSAVSKSLLEKGDYVIGIDNHNDYYDPKLKYERIKKLKNYENYIHFMEDIADKEKIDKIFRSYKIDKVINLAAQAGVRYSIENPLAYINSNICLLYTSPSPRDRTRSRMPSSA